MSEVNIYRVTGFYRKGLRKIPINMDIRALKVEDALEKVYTDVGSKHLVKRKDIFIPKDGGVSVLGGAEEARVREYLDLDESNFSIPRS